MKNIITRFNGKVVLLIALMFTLASCKDFLTVQNKAQADDGTVWSSAANADLFLNNVYSSLFDLTRLEDPEEDYTDNSVGKEGEKSVTVYDKGAYTAASVGNVNFWNGSNGTGTRQLFTDIRKVNLFIQKLTASPLAADYKKLRIAEARMLRAWFYMLLWTHYGGVPIITDILNLTEQGDAIFRARNTDAETEKFISDECVAAAADLPLTTPDHGRATKGAALTLKGWVELFNASPLKNTANDKARWALAAATNKQVMDLGVYKLMTESVSMFFAANNNNSETIWDKEHLGGVGSLGGSKEGLWGTNFIFGIEGSWAGPNPTQNMVDAYQMANGKDITDPTSGYDPQHPYVGRDPRFYNDIVYDGAPWAGDIITTRVGGNNPTDVSGTSDFTNTGYYPRKGLDPANAISGTNGLSSATWQYFRYAEVLLSYAEAQNEAVGPDASVYAAINQVRNRAGLPSLAAGLTYTQMQTAIWHERRVELFFEDRRWYDLIRLKQAEIYLNQPSQGMKITTVGGNLVYTIINSSGGGRKFNAPQNYLWPVPQTAIDKNKNLTQNPGY